jgi:hypothetical protein
MTVLDGLRGSARAWLENRVREFGDSRWWSPRTTGRMASAIGVMGPRRRRAPLVVEDGLGHRSSSHGTMRTAWTSEGDARRECDIVGNPQELAQIVLHPLVPHRERTPVAQGPGGQQEVLAGGVHRSALVRVRITMSNHAHEHDHRNTFDVVAPWVNQDRRRIRRRIRRFEFSRPSLAGTLLRESTWP